MDLKIDFDPAAVAEKLKDAILTSTFKEMFAKAVDEHIKSITETKGWGNYQSQLNEMVKNFVSIQIREILQTNYKEQINRIILEKFTETKLSDLVEKFVDKIKLSDY